MQIEITVREILREGTNAEQMADRICKILRWDRDKLITAIRTFGTSDNKGRSAIISVFWNKEKLRKEKEERDKFK